MDVVKREELEYLFVDMEWNQAPGTKELEGREPVQIAAIATNSDFYIAKMFSKAIRVFNADLISEDMVLCVIGIINHNIGYLAAILGFICADEVGKGVGWH